MGYGELDTPSVIVDLDVLERNIAEMAAVANGGGGATAAAFQDA